MALHNHQPEPRRCNGVALSQHVFLIRQLGAKPGPWCCCSQGKTTRDRRKLLLRRESSEGLKPPARGGGTHNLLPSVLRSSSSRSRTDDGPLQRPRSCYKRLQRTQRE